jgi:EpsD family peptidyl-prolyl cis-trans isomerase
MKPALIASATLLALAFPASALAQTAQDPVIATVGGEPITASDLNTELQRSPARPGADQTLLRQVAVQRIVERKIVAQIARRRGVDKTHAYLAEQRRNDELVLAGLLRDQIVVTLPEPSATEIAQYQQAHPERFAQRKVFSVNQILFPAPASPDKLKELASLKTLDQLAAKLAADHIQYLRATNQLDSSQLPPEIVSKISALAPGSLFILPTSQGLTANVLTQSKIDPMPADQARAIALAAVRDERLGKAAEAQLSDSIAKARATATYQPGYAPPPPPAGTGPVPPAPPAPPANP